MQEFLKNYSNSCLTHVSSPINIHKATPMSKIQFMGVSRIKGLGICGNFLIKLAIERISELPVCSQFFTPASACRIMSLYS